MKGKDPAFLLYTDAFIGGTVEMTDAEVGRYFRLLLKQHSKGYITEEDYEKAKPRVQEKFILGENGFYYNPRMSEEIEKRKKFTNSRRANGSKGGRPPKEEKPSANLVETTSKPSENLPKNTNKDKDINIDTDTNTNKDISTNTDTNTNKDISTNTDTNTTSTKDNILSIEKEIFG